MFQGKGIGRIFFDEILNEIPMEEGSVLLHLDSRRDVAGFYEKVGMKRLSEEVFVKYGPTGKGEGVEHIKMGMLLDR
jgi:predicted GNAT family N-acyltransferase